MEWTYTTYTVANYGITIALVLSCIIGVFATFFSSKKGQEFVIERVIGVNPTKAHDDYNEHDSQQQNGKNLFSDPDEYNSAPKPWLTQVKQKSVFYIGIFCCLLGGLILSITAVLMFQGCVLTDVRVLPDDDCPEYPMGCFVFTGSAFTPITQNATFLCESLSKAQFPVNITDATAWCYAWIIRYQSTKSVLDQLGVAIALIGFFTTMLAVVVYLGKCKKTIALSIVYIVASITMMIVLLVLKISFAPLTYAIFALGAALGVFGLVLFCILPTPKNKVGNVTMLTNSGNRPTGINDSDLPHAKQPKFIQVKATNQADKINHR
ncbi:hypothetical protein I4U23_011261 [Adineta vaga]|nr:hypothetical protein I4U23_011261 [Adineta vaga]